MAQEFITKKQGRIAPINVTYLANGELAKKKGGGQGGQVWWAGSIDWARWAVLK